MREKHAWAVRHADAIRRTLLLEPRGHIDLSGVVLTEPTEPGSDAGLLFMHGGGFATMCGNAVLAAAAIVRERALLARREDDGRVVFDTAAGTIRTAADPGAGDGRASAGGAGVRVRHVPSFVLRPGVEVEAAGRTVRADLACAGAFYAIVDAESAGVPVDGAHLDGLRRAARAIRAAFERGPDIVHPVEPGIAGIHGVVFTAPPQSSGADLRSTTVLGDDAVDRAPGVDAAAAILAVLDAMGLVAGGRAVTFEGIAGQTFAGDVVSRTAVGEHAAVVAEIEGTAWMTGEHTFFAADADPLARGFRPGMRGIRA